MTIIRPVSRVDRELNIRPARLDADLADHRQRRIAHPLVFLVAQGLRRRHRDRIARMDAHRVEILDRADDHDVVVLVAHHLHLVLFPAEDRFLDEHLRGGRRVEAAADEVVVLGPAVSDRRTAAAHGEARPHHCRQADLVDPRAGFLDRLHCLAEGRFQADLVHRFLKPLAALGLVDHVGIGADHLDAILLEHAMLRKIHRHIEPRLSAERRQQRIGPLLLDHLGDDFPGERLDVGAIGGRRIGHDRRRIRVHQHDLVAFFAQGFARLRAGIVKFAGLADHNGAGTNDENLLQVVASGHRAAWGLMTG